MLQFLKVVLQFLKVALVFEKRSTFCTEDIPTFISNKLFVWL